MTAVSERVRAARVAENLSLDDLAQRSGLSKGTLVNIERAKANPSIGVMVQLAAALRVSVADLLESAKPAEAPVTVFDPARDGRIAWRGAKGGTARLAAGTSGPAMVEFWHWQMFPGEKHKSAAHSPGTREIVIVTAGALGLSVNASQQVVAKGRGALIEADRPHAYWCEGDKAVRFTMYVSEWPQ